MSGERKKLVLAVVDALKPEMLDRAVADGRAPVLAALIERGIYVRDCVSSFPSLTPVAAASIATGAPPDEHGVPSMNWYHRGEERYVEYGSSFAASQAFGPVRALYDTVYNLNLAHLSRRRKTVFEHLDDAGVRTAGTTYLIYRGRTRHEPVEDGVYSRIARAAQFRHAVWGPRELFYADIFASRETGCRSTLGMPGQRDQHAGCVGEHLVERDLFDFLLLSLPDNDTHSHRRGPFSQVTSIASADRALERVMGAAGGLEPFLEEHAVIVMSDHSQSPVEQPVTLAGALDGLRVLAPADPSPEEADVAVCPGGRFAAVYVLDPDRRGELVPEIAGRLADADGVDLCLRREGGEAIALGAAGELRFAPGRELEDLRGARWSVAGEVGVLDLEVEGGRVASRTYPDALGRAWSALACRTSGDVLVSAVPGYELADWGGGGHLGGGSHGSLHRQDSLGVLIACGTGPRSAAARDQWTIRDAAPLVLDHFCR
ncbi:MAG: alkaline phosphatase family protein [Actinomycetota bacterium]|nr:alkaline phosphatase family protein [Actinomycetota bacterium]